MSSDNMAFVNFLADVKARASALEKEDYISEDVRRVLRDFLKVSESFAALESDSVSTGADARLFKKRLDQSKAEVKAAEKKIATLKDIDIQCIIAVRQISNETAHIADPEAKARVNASLKKMAELLLSVSKV